MRTLCVGDVHATPDDLDDCAALVLEIERAAQAHSVDEILFLGDQYHTHAIVHVEAMAFWHRAFARLSKLASVRVLVGNHDRPGDSSSASHAFLAHPNVMVVDSPTVANGVLYVPYYHSNDAFVKACEKNANLKVVVCHQSFNGGTYENGSYMADGVDPAAIPQTTVISGHIHAPQRFDKVWYPGAPRWRTLADANTDRAIHVLDFCDGGVSVLATVDTGKVCRRIVYSRLSPESQELPAAESKDRLYVDVHGPEDFVKTCAASYRAQGARVRTFPDARKVIKIKESDGIPKAFSKFVKLFQPPNGSDVEMIEEVINGRLSVAAPNPRS